MLEDLYDRISRLWSRRWPVAEGKVTVEGKKGTKLEFAHHPNMVVKFDAAAKAITVYEQNPDFVKAAKDAAVAGKAKALLNLAEAYKRAGRDDLATAKLQRVIDDYPDTSFAQQARQALDQLKVDGGGNSAP